MNRKILITVLGILALAGVIPMGGCRPGKQSDADDKTKGIPVVLKTVQLRSLQRSIPVVGSLAAQEDVTISAKVPGRIIATPVDVGDQVAPGQAITRIDPVDYELVMRQRELALSETLARLGLERLPPDSFDITTLPAVVRSRLQRDNALARYERGRQLHDQTPPLISDQDFADLKTTWEVAVSNYDMEILTARSLLTDAHLKAADLEVAVVRWMDANVLAPQGADGYVVAGRLVSVGEYVKEGAPLYRLIAQNPIKLRAAVPERYAGQAKTGMSVRLKTEAWPQEFTGTLARINPAVDPASRTFQIEASVPNNEGKLKAGSFVQAWIDTHLDEGVVFVPLESVVTFAGISKVFTVRDGKAVENVIQTGTVINDQVEIIGGLGGQNAVVVSGMSKLADQTPVVVRQPESKPTVESGPEDKK